MHAANVHGLFMPHGLGHSVGLDVHDPQVSGVYGRPHVQGNVFTVEPGAYFIPRLIRPVLADGADPRHRFLGPAANLEALYEFGGVRVEDVLLVTEGGWRNLSPGLRTVEEMEEAMQHRHHHHRATAALRGAK
jgi:Xaa-Pro aminopeptidase